MEREQGNGAAMEYSLAAMASCCRRAWLKEENNKGERENAEQGRNSGVHFVSSAYAHAQGEWGHGLSMMATWQQAFV